MNLKETRYTKRSTRRPLKLGIELVPKPLWEHTLRSNEGLGKPWWGKLRRGLIKKRGPCCAICGVIGKRLHGHEVWGYREKKTIGLAVLLRVEIVCIDCHDVHHWGRRRSYSRLARSRQSDIGILESTFALLTAVARKFLTITFCKVSEFGRRDLRNDGRSIGASLLLSWRKRRRLA